MLKNIVHAGTFSIASRPWSNSGKFMMGKMNSCLTERITQVFWNSFLRYRALFCPFLYVVWGILLILNASWLDQFSIQSTNKTFRTSISSKYRSGRVNTRIVKTIFKIDSCLIEKIKQLRCPMVFINFRIHSPVERVMQIHIQLHGKANKVSLPLRFGIHLTERHQVKAQLEDFSYDEDATKMQSEYERDKGRRHYIGTLKILSPSDSAENIRVKLRAVVQDPHLNHFDPVLVTVLGVEQTQVIMRSQNI